MSHLMDYGPDWPPPNTSPKGTSKPERPRAAARHLLLNVVLLVGAFLVVAVLAIASDRPQHVEFPMTSSTTPHASSTHTQGTP